MARIPRMVITGEPTVYHVISRTALDGFAMGDREKEFLLNLIKRLSSVYFAEVLGFCLMGTHFHVLCRMHPGDGVTDEKGFGDRRIIQACDLALREASQVIRTPNRC
jgi:putative transposase